MIYQEKIVFINSQWTIYSVMAIFRGVMAKYNSPEVKLVDISCRYSTDGRIRAHIIFDCKDTITTKKIMAHIDGACVALELAARSEPKPKFDMPRMTTIIGDW